MMPILPFPHRPPRPHPIQIFSFGPLRFSIEEAQRRATRYTPRLERPAPEWFDARIPLDARHLERCGTGGLILFATVLLDGWRQRILIDGNHRAACALQNRSEVSVVTLNLEDTLAVLSGPPDMLEQMRSDGIEQGLLPEGYSLPRQ